MAVWREDILGAGFACTDLDLGEDEEGPLVATLIRALPERRSLLDRLIDRERTLENVDVLYVHGWSDYFFQRNLARFWTDRGARFFALDLRKYGRSLREGQTAGYIERLEDYHEEVELALAVMRSEQDPRDRPRRVVLFGHSTGGLVISLWASKNPDYADALLLNSPWLEFQLASTGRQMIAPLINLGARLNPRDVAPQLDYGYYTRAQREVGPQDELAAIDPLWRPERTHAVTNGWLRAILEGHARVSEGLRIGIPIGVFLSARSTFPVRWSEDMTRADTVLEVDEIAKAALKLGPSVTVERIDDALHDIFLSRQEAREEAYARLDRWLIGWQAATGGESPPLPPRGSGRAATG